MKKPSVPRARAALGAVAALAGAGALAAPALGAVNEPPVAPHTITALASSDGVDVIGYDPGEILTITLQRGPYTMATTGPVVASDTGGGLIGVLVNHPPATGPTTCWQGAVPDVSAGDVIAVTRANGDVDRMRVADIGLTKGPTLVNGDVVLEGFARTPAGDRLTDLFGQPPSIPGLAAEIRAPKGTTFTVGGAGGNVIDATFAGGGGLGTVTWGTGTAWKAAWSLIQADQDKALGVGGDPSSPGVVWTGETGTDVTRVDGGVTPGADISCGASSTSFGRPTIPDLLATSDTGASDTDDVTSDNTPTLVGAAGRAPIGGLARILVDGVEVASQSLSTDKTYTITLPPLADGTHQIVMRETSPTVTTSGALTVTVDTTAPAPPVLTTDPLGPADQNAPKVVGTAEAGATVRLYSGVGCTGTPIATGSSAALAAGFPVAVADDSLASWSATATDALGNTSGCSISTTFIEQTTTPPGVVTLLGGRLPLSRGWKTRVTLSCTGPVGAVCFGRLALVARVDTAPGRAVRIRAVEVGSKAFAIRAGRTSSVLVTVARSARPVIQKAGSLRARISITTSIGSGRVSVGNRVITLVAPAR